MINLQAYSFIFRTYSVLETAYHLVSAVVIYLGVLLYVSAKAASPYVARAAIVLLHHAVVGVVALHNYAMDTYTAHYGLEIA